eukprot:COSAG05_NODE_741_length_7601_cov_8.262997_6_plen_107_part_00
MLQREDRGSRKDAAKARRERQEAEKRDAKRQKGYANALGKEQEKAKLAYQVRSLTGAIDLWLTRTCLLMTRCFVYACRLLSLQMFLVVLAVLVVLSCVWLLGRGRQ